MKVVVEDKNRIKEVVFKYPHLMSGSAANDIKEEYYDILELEEELDKYRHHVRSLYLGQRGADFAGSACAGFGSEKGRISLGRCG